jgi:hypothetical protein
VQGETQIIGHLSTLKLRIAGALILLAFVFYGGGTALIANGLASFGLALMLTNSIAVIVIGVYIRSAITVDAPFTANVYLLTRLVEGLLLGLGAMALVLADNAELNSILYRIGMIVLGLGSIGFCRWLLCSKRIHALHAWLGLIGYPLMAIGMIVGFFGFEFWSSMLLIPGALFELSFGLYLIFFGLGSN